MNNDTQTLEQIETEAVQENPFGTDAEVGAWLDAMEAEMIFDDNGQLKVNAFNAGLGSFADFEIPSDQDWEDFLANEADDALLAECSS